MCAKILQLVNSAFFGLHQPMANPGEAVAYLGLNTIKGLVLSLQIFSLFERVKIRGFSYEELWVHCWLTGSVGQTHRIRAKQRPGHGRAGIHRRLAP